MSIQSDIISAMTTAGITNIYPQAVPEDQALPFIIYRVLNSDTLGMLNGDLDETNSTVVFECWADDYDEAMTLKASVQAAIEGSGLTWYRETAPADEYEQAIDAYMEPTYYGFWHN